MVEPWVWRNNDIRESMEIVARFTVMYCIQWRSQPKNWGAKICAVPNV